MNEDYYRVIRKILISALISILLIVLLEVLYKTDGIKQILSILEKPVLVRSAAFAVLLFSILILLNKNFSIIFSKIYHYLIQLLLIYIYFRFYSGYNLIKISNTIYFIDFIFVLNLYTVEVLILKSLRISNSRIDEKSGFIYEKPLENKENILEKDSFTRSPFVKKLIEKVKNTNLNSGSFGIGIIGKWGTGKTSFMELMKYELKKSNPDSILIDFNPWQNENSQQITEAFFDLLSYELGKRTISVSRLINTYLNKLSGKANAFTTILNVFTFSRSSEKLYLEIQDTLVQLNRTIFIFIDDLDRLDEQEIKSVFKLIRNTANFKNTVFVVGYDQEYIERQLNKTDINIHEYLKKIFNIQIPLPFIDEDSLIKYVDQKINENVLCEFKELSDYIKNQQHILAHELKNVRDLNSIVNSYSLITDVIGEDVDKNDLFILELLRLNYPNIYFGLIYETDQYLVEGKGKYKLLEEEKLQKNCSASLPLLRILFNETHEHVEGYKSVKSNKTISIRHIRYFERFFILKLLDKEISNKEFMETMNSDFESIVKNLDYWIEKKSFEDLLYKLRSKEKNDFGSKKIYLNYLESYLYILHKIYVPVDSDYVDQILNSTFNLISYDLDKDINISLKYYEDSKSLEDDVTKLIDKYFFQYDRNIQSTILQGLILRYNNLRSKSAIKIKSFFHIIQQFTNSKISVNYDPIFYLFMNLSIHIDNIKNVNNYHEEVVNKYQDTYLNNLENLPVNEFIRFLDKQHVVNDLKKFIQYYYKGKPELLIAHLKKGQGFLTQDVIKGITNMYKNGDSSYI